jgi:ABC-type antimicrobial peptide transport system permease subunit
MIFSYFFNFLRANKLKVAILCISVIIYFTACGLVLTIGQALPQITKAPLNTIGSSVMVQTQGVIPDKIEGIVFPHANGPLYNKQLSKISKLKFVKASDSALYFWDFSESYKSIVGFKQNGAILKQLLSKNIAKGKLPLKKDEALVSFDYFNKHNLKIGDSLKIKGSSFHVAAELKAVNDAQVMPSDLYIDLASAQKIAASSPDIRRNYKLNSPKIINVILLKTDPVYSGDKNRQIKAIDKNLLIFSEQTFSKQVESKLNALPGIGKSFLVILGIILIMAFGGLVFYMIRNREDEIAILRALGWQSKTIRRQFMQELMIIMLISLIAGNIVLPLSINFIAKQKVSMEIPWEISAKPHFLQTANSINRTVTSPIPLVPDYRLYLLLSVIFALIFLGISRIVLGRINRIKALSVMLH